MAYAAAPTAIKTIRAKKSLGTPVDLSAVVLAGTVVSYFYLLFSYGFDWLITVNYGAGAVSWSVLLLYGVFRNVAIQ